MITYPVHIPVPIKSSRFGLDFNKARYTGEFVRNRIAQSHGAGTTDRWEGVFTTPFLNKYQHREMTAWLEAMSDDEGTFYAFNPDHRSSGGHFDDSNLLGTSAEAEHSSAQGDLFLHVGPPGAGIPLRAFGLFPGDTITHQTLLRSATGVDNLRADLHYYTKDGVHQDSLLSPVIASSTYISATATGVIPPSAVNFQFFTRNLSTTETAFSKQSILIKGTGPSFVPYLKVNGAAQTGNSIAIKSAPASVRGLLYKGDYIQVENQLYKLKQRLDSNSGGLATAEIMPAIRTAPPDNEPIIVRNPTMIAQLVEADHHQETNHNSGGVISFAWQEVL